MEELFRRLMGIIAGISFIAIWIYGIYDGFRTGDVLVTLPFAILCLVVLWYCIKIFVNRNPSKEKVWSFREFISKQGRFEVYGRNGQVYYIEFSDFIFKNNIKIRVNEFNFRSKQDIMDDADSLVVKQLVSGDYKLEGK